MDRSWKRNFRSAKNDMPPQGSRSERADYHFDRRRSLERKGPRPDHESPVIQSTRRFLAVPARGMELALIHDGQETEIQGDVPSVHPGVFSGVGARFGSDKKLIGR